MKIINFPIFVTLILFYTPFIVAVTPPKKRVYSSDNQEYQSPPKKRTPPVPRRRKRKAPNSLTNSTATKKLRDCVGSSPNNNTQSMNDKLKLLQQLITELQISSKKGSVAKEPALALPLIFQPEDPLRPLK